MKRANADSGADDDATPKQQAHPLFADLTNWQVVEIEGEASPVHDVREQLDAAQRGDAAASDLHRRKQDDQPRPLVDAADEVIVLSMETRAQSIAPGNAALYSISVLNNGQHTATFTPAIEGWVAQEWTHFSPSHTRLHPGASATFEITITPPRLPSSRTGEHSFAIVVRADTQPVRRAQLSATLTIEPLVDFTLGELHPRRLQTSWRRATANLVAPLTNHSNTNLYVEIDGASAHGDQRFEFAAPGAVAPQIGRTSFMLTPGQTMHVACRITPHSRPLLGLGARKTPFRISAHGVQVNGALADGTLVRRPARTDSRVWPQLGEQNGWDASRTVQGMLSQAPLLGPGAMSALAGCALTLLLGVGLTGLVALLALIPALRGQSAAPTQTVAAPPAALEIVVKVAEPVAVPHVAASNVAAQTAPQADASHNVAQAVTTLQEHGQPIVVQPPANPVTAQAQPASANSPANLPVAANGEAPQVTADQITQPGQVYAAPPASTNGQTDNSAPIVQPNMISNPSGAEAAPASAPPTAADPAAVNTTTMTYEQLFRSIAQQYNLDWRMLAAQAYVESSFNPLALGAKGDLGLMQVLPSTWKEWAPRVNVADPFDSYSNVLVAAVYLDYLRTTFAAQGYTDPEWMLIAYNWGPNQVRNFLNGGGELENLDESLQQYARDVLRIAESLPRE